MMGPALEIRLILSAPGEGWQYVVRKAGEAIAASSEYDEHPQPVDALAAAVLATKATLKHSGQLYQKGSIKPIGGEK